MAHYATTVRTDLSPADAFVYVAELTNLAEWDPGVRSASQINGDGPGPDAAYAVTLSSPGSTKLTYKTTRYDGDALTTTLVAKHTWFTSIDTVTAAPSGDGAEVTYDAELQLCGPLALGDLLFRPVFQRIGDNAARGLVTALDGVKVA